MIFSEKTATPDLVQQQNKVETGTFKHDVVINIVNYKTKEYLETCLETLFGDLEGSNLDYKIIITDNNSGDNLSELEAKYPQIKFIYLEENLGYGTANNKALSQEDANVFLILNPDIEFIEQGTILKMYDRLVKDDQIAVVGPRLETTDGKTQKWDHGGENFLKQPVFSEWKERLEPTEVNWVSGAVFGILGEIFQEVDGFDERFFLYHEELDLCLRILKLGKKVLYDPEITVKHIGSVSTNRGAELKKSTPKLVEKYYGNSVFGKVLQVLTGLVPAKMYESN